MLSLLKKRPDASDVARRLLILKHQVVHALATPPADVVQALSVEGRETLGAKFKALSDSMCAGLRQNGLWKHLTATEKRYFETPGPLLAPQDLVNSLWRAEAAGCLCWSLGLLPEIPAYDTQVDPEVLQPIGTSGVKTFIQQARLRDSREIDNARSVAELWHWRSRTRQLQEQGHVGPVAENAPDLVGIVAMVAEKASAAGEIPGPIDGDFPIFDKAYRDASPLEWSVAQSIAMERHFALNWLSGYSRRNDWTSTPTDT